MTKQVLERKASSSNGKTATRGTTGTTTWLTDDKFRDLVEGLADYEVIMLDKDGVVLTWNIGAQI